MGMDKKKSSQNPVNGRAPMAQILWNLVNGYGKEKAAPEPC